MAETKSIGICIGAATLSAVEVRRDENNRLTVNPVYVEPHQGNPREALRSVLAKLGPNGGYKVAVTGRKFRHAVNLSSISEPEAVESALSYLNGKGRHYDAVISAGGETFLVYVLTEDGKISSIQTGNKCASGTGEFFIQQLRRIGLTPEDAVRFAVAEKPYRVSGRCSVFCKSDCTHATNKGVPKGRVAAGLCEMMAGKIIEIAGQIPK
ncbi:MAG TPA: BadF/BadG/BcrA/BcrD ATPase family protein, partial [Syntrophales bacterium]|nr:BadF/BadG/BcrA/BcrD ATPase family protein [Syntrophales bacterium]